MKFVTALMLTSLGASTCLAAPITLKEYNSAGYTFAATPDTMLNSYSGVKEYNAGGMSSFTGDWALYTNWRAVVVKFDLNAIPDKNLVIGVNSAKLRVYRAGYQFGNVNLQATQLAQDWVEGTSNGDWSGVCDGAQWFTRNAGTVVAKTALSSYGGGIYYISNVTNLANDPVNSGKLHVRLSASDGNYRNAQDSFTSAASLAALQALGGTRGYYWDSAAGRLYLNKNDYDIRWYSSGDQWTTPGGTITGSAVTSSPTSSAATWVEFDVKTIVTNWLVSGQGNYGVRIIEAAAGGSTLATSEATDPTLRPELIVDVVYGQPQPAISLTSTTVAFSGHAVDPAPAAQSATVQNGNGIGSLAWTAAVRAPAPAWVSLANASGTDNGTFNVSVNWQGMATGTYTAYVDVTDPNAGNSPQTVTVTMQVLAPPQPALQVTPATLTFSGHAADPLPAAQNVTVQNSGGAGSLAWTAAVRAPAPAWISLANTTGTDDGQFSVSANWQNMTAGTYAAYVDVTDPNAVGSPKTVTVTLQVIAPPQGTIQLSPNSLTFAAKASDPTPAPRIVTVQNAGNAPLAWSAAVRAPAPVWLALVGTSGTDNGTFTVSVDHQGLAIGTYTAYADVTDPAATNPSQALTVTLQVRPDADASTHSFTNSSRGTHPNTLTTGSTVTVNLSSLPAGTQIFRAILVPHSGGFQGGSGGATSPLKVQSADAAGIWLQTVAPRHKTLDCTAAAQRALLAGDKTLRLNLVSYPAGLGSEVRLDVWCDAPAGSAIQQVANLQAVHRGGDTMLTFAEVNPPVTAPSPTLNTLNTARSNMDAPNEVRYRIYRSSQPIDTLTIRTAELVDEISPMSGWNWTYQTSGDMSNEVIPTLPVDDTVLSAVGAGIYVRRAPAAGSAYYAVSRAVNGQEDLSVWSSANSLSSAVTEDIGTGMVLLHRQSGPETYNFENNTYRYYYVKWECPPNWNTPSYAHNYMVGVPGVAVNPRPVDVALHCWGGSVHGDYGWWYEANHGALLVATNEDPYDWWTAFHENRGTIRPWTNVEGNAGGVCRNFSQKRIWSFVNDFVASHWTIDSNHILLTGVSMGGSGASMWGVRAGDKFAYVDSWVGVHIPRGTPLFKDNFAIQYGPDTWACLYDNTGLNVWDYWDDNQWLRGHVAAETPFMACSNGKNDGAIGWNQAWLFAKALQETRRPHLFKWGQNGHGERAALPGTLSDRYIDIDIDLNKTLPAFTYCSLDNNPGDGTDSNGDASGMLNGYMLWQPQDSTDTAGKWEITSLLISAAPAATCTVDITPRRCQAFRPTAGTICAWTNTDVTTGSTLASGTVTVDANSLVTVPQATVTKSKTRLTIKIVGDINGDGHVDLLDLLVLAATWGKSTGQAGYDARCDIDNDGSINVVDLLILADNFGT